MTNDKDRDIIPGVARNYGDCSDTLIKGVFAMDYIIYLLVLITVLEIIKNIKK